MDSSGTSMTMNSSSTTNTSNGRSSRPNMTSSIFMNDASHDTMGGHSMGDGSSVMDASSGMIGNDTIYDNVICGNAEGSLVLTSEELIFAPDDSAAGGAGPMKRWNLLAIKSHSVSAAHVTLQLHFKSSQTAPVLLKMEVLGELIGFRKSLLRRIRRLQQTREQEELEQSQQQSQQQQERGGSSCSHELMSEEQEQAPDHSRRQTTVVLEESKDNNGAAPVQVVAVDDLVEAKLQQARPSNRISPRPNQQQQSQKQRRQTRASRRNPRSSTATSTAFSTYPSQTTKKEDDDVLPPELLERESAMRFADATSEELTDVAIAQEVLAITSAAASNSPENSFATTSQSQQQQNHTSTSSSTYPQRKSNEGPVMVKTGTHHLNQGSSITMASTSFGEHSTGEFSATDAVAASTSRSRTRRANNPVAASISERGTPGAFSRIPGNNSTRNSIVDYSAAVGKQKLAEESCEIMTASGRSLRQSSVFGGTSGRRAGRMMAASSRSLHSSCPPRMSTSNLVEACLVEDAEVRDSEVVVPQAIKVEDDDNQRKKYFNFSSAACGCVLGVVVIVAVVVAIVLTKGGSGSSHATNDAERLKLFQKITEPLAPPGQDLSEAAIQACEWISDDDPLRLDPADASLKAKIAQRYTLAVFHFQTSPSRNGWKYCAKPETGESDACVNHVVESYGVEGVYQNQYMSEPSFRWLTGVDECQWAGVLCEDNEHVTHLTLGDYGLKNSLPFEMIHLQHLKSLDLQQNELEGPLPFPDVPPPEAHANQLRNLRLDQNKFSGSIPSGICRLATQPIREINIGLNQLRGTLPECIGKLSQLEDLSVMHNQLSGTVPEVLKSLPKLKRLHLAQNQFEGWIPQDLCLTDTLIELSSDCLEPSADTFVACDCCTKCCSGEDCELTYDAVAKAKMVKDP